ncbi:MAG TPA: PAS domain S-box protein [Chryseosolibacter sp.]|nr:PAS domain S-box protein [Chryseosolibacter sp.]
MENLTQSKLQGPSPNPNTSSRPVKVGDGRFERMIEEVEDYAILLLDKKGTVLTWNKGAERIKGYQAKEIIGKSFRLFYSKEDKDNGLPDALLSTAIKDGRANHEGWRIRKDGKRFWGSVTLTCLHDDSGDITGILKLTRDLTERKAAEDRFSNYVEDLQQKNEELQRSEERYHKMVSEVTDYAIILLDPEGKILDWNKGAESLKGYKASEIIGKSFRVFYSQADKETHLPRRLLDIAIEKGSVSAEGWRIRKDGSRFWANVTITALHGEDERIIGFSKVTKDLTAKKVAEDILSNAAEELRQRNEELRISEERYHRMIAEVQDYAILLLDKDGFIQNWNAGAAFVKGYEASEIIGKNFRQFYMPEDIERKVPDQLLERARTHGKANSEGWRVRKNGTKFWGSVVITALHNNAGEIIGFSKVTRDLTERKEADDLMRKTAEELAAKNKVLENLNNELSSFAYIVSHDLKEPVRKIQIFAGRQREADKSREEILEFSDKIEKTAARMQQLMEDLLRYAELSHATEAKSVDLNHIVNIVTSDLEVAINEKNASITSDILPRITGVPHQLQQVFLNLFVNALKFSKEDVPPKVTVRYQQTSPAGIDVPGSLYHEISITDNGIGFDQLYADRIFEVFQRLHSKTISEGSGIGLAIVQKVMSNHHGFVRAQSTPGHGATFSLYFPIEDSQAKQ